jgi:hypothetical protein
VSSTSEVESESESESSGDNRRTKGKQKYSHTSKVSGRRNHKGEEALDMLRLILQQAASNEQPKKMNRRRGRKSNVDRDVLAMKEAETAETRSIFLVRLCVTFYAD